MFQVFQLPIQAECTRVTKVYDYCGGNVYLFIICIYFNKLNAIY